MKFLMVAMSNSYQLENQVDEHSFLGHICSLKLVLGGFNEQLWPKICLPFQLNQFNFFMPPQEKNFTELILTVKYLLYEIWDIMMCRILCRMKTILVRIFFLHTSFRSCINFKKNNQILVKTVKECVKKNYLDWLLASFF